MGSYFYSNSFNQTKAFPIKFECVAELLAIGVKLTKRTQSGVKGLSDSSVASNFDHFELYSSLFEYLETVMKISHLLPFTLEATLVHGIAFRPHLAHNDQQY